MGGVYAKTIPRVWCKYRNYTHRYVLNTLSQSFTPKDDLVVVSCRIDSCMIFRFAVLPRFRGGMCCGVRCVCPFRALEASAVPRQAQIIQRSLKR